MPSPSLLVIKKHSEKEAICKPGSSLSLDTELESDTLTRHLVLDFPDGRTVENTGLVCKEPVCGVLLSHPTGLMQHSKKFVKPTKVCARGFPGGPAVRRCL